MKSITKILLLAAVGAVVVAISVAPSEAAKKKAMSCTGMPNCTAACKGKSCEIRTCTDGKWVTPLLVKSCTQPDCPAKC